MHRPAKLEDLRLPPPTRGLMACARLALAVAFVLVLLAMTSAPLGAAERPAGARTGAVMPAQAGALEPLQADVRETLGALEQLQRYRSVLNEVMRDAEPLDDLREELNELREALTADTRALFAALERALARDPASLPELDDAARRYGALTDRLAPQLRSTLVLAPQIRDLDDFRAALERHVMRLRKQGVSRERLAALEREGTQTQVERRTLVARLADNVAALRDSLRELSASSCTVYRRLDVAGPEGCRAAALAAPPVETAALPEIAAPPVASEERRAPPVMAAPAPRPPRILHSVYSLFDREAREPPGYGLYTYVLFPAPGPQNASFVAALIASTDVASEESDVDRRQINLFSLPVQDATHSPRVIADPERFAKETYDRDAARGFLSRLCDNPQAARLSVCDSAWRGPYLLTHPRPQSQLETLELPYLFVDLSHVRERAYGEFIRAVKEQVKRPDFTDREKIETFRLRLLNITLSAADWVRPVSNGIEGIISLAGLGR